jgi:hypothetical protein
MSNDMFKNLRRFQLEKVGTIDFSDGTPVYCSINIGDPAHETPAVYLFCSRQLDWLEIFYVGKAGKGIRKRMEQHRGGFIKRRAEGKKHNLGDALSNRIQANHTIEIWLRRAGTLNFKIIDDTLVTLPDLDMLELGLIKLLRDEHSQPLVNKGDMISRGMLQS